MWIYFFHCAVLGLVVQLCPTLCDPMNCSPGSFVHGDSPGSAVLGVGCHALLLGIFPNQGSNPGLLHCRQIRYCLCPGNPLYSFWNWDILGWCKHNCCFCIVEICCLISEYILNKCGHFIDHFNTHFSLYFFANDLLFAIHLIFILN